MYVIGSYFQPEGVYIVITAGIILFIMPNKSINGHEVFIRVEVILLCERNIVESDTRDMNQSEKLLVVEFYTKRKKYHMTGAGGICFYDVHVMLL